MAKLTQTPLVSVGAAVLALGLCAANASADTLAKYSVEQLLSPCQEADNDSRWGEAAETECEQYLIGFTDSLVLAGLVGKEKGICLPEQNRADEVRWAFMRWVHESYSARRKLSAAEGLMAALQDKMPCE